MRPFGCILEGADSGPNRVRFGSKQGPNMVKQGPIKVHDWLRFGRSVSIFRMGVGSFILSLFILSVLRGRRTAGGRRAE